MLTWFSSKKNIIRTTLLEGMTDVHAHLLPNVDGGSESLMDSIAALERMKEVGVKRIFLTPHIMAEFPNNTPELLCAKYAILKECCPPEIELHLAAEYMLDDGFEAYMKGMLFTLPGRQVLVETSWFVGSRQISDNPVRPGIGWLYAWLSLIRSDMGI